MQGNRYIGGTCILFLLVLAIYSAALPTNLDNLTVVSNTSRNLTAGTMINSSGGVIYTLNINATTQDIRWKGYVGWINGGYSLADSSLNALLDWNIDSLTGEIYATRNSSAVNWDAVACANDTLIAAEQVALSMTSGMPDNIARTFNSTVHDGFYAGATEITADTCYSTALNVNGTAQGADFQEVLLGDGGTLVYTSLIENLSYGYNNTLYDFQMIVAENALQGWRANTAYYFYVELI